MFTVYVIEMVNRKVFMLLKMVKQKLFMSLKTENKSCLCYWKHKQITVCVIGNGKKTVYVIENSKQKLFMLLKT